MSDMTTILVIEDENSLRSNIAETLTYEGFEVIQAENGRAGIGVLERAIPDLILCDVMMPEMDGYQVLKAIRSKTETALIPFIFITALAERENIRSGMDLGADDYLSKPFTREELLSAVNTRLKKQETSRSQAESALDELRISLISNLPHELRTPLNGIIGYGELMRDYSENLTTADIIEYGSVIYESGMRLYRLVQNYLIFAQLELESGSRVSYPEQENVGELVPDCVMKIAQKYRRNSDLVFGETSGHAKIKLKEFLKIVEELTDNAFKFSKAGSKVQVVCRQENSMLLFQVSDQGRGMLPAELKKIGAYMQFNRRLNEQQGSGLGLAIVQRIVKINNGDFSAESLPGSGTTITITIPA